MARERDAMNRGDFSERDAPGRKVLVALNQRKHSVTWDLFSAYWRDAHAPIIAPAPQLYHYRQIHTDHHQPGFWPGYPGVSDHLAPEHQLDGIAELSFRSEADCGAFLAHVAPLVVDHDNMFRTSELYEVNDGNGNTFVDRLPDQVFNGHDGCFRLISLFRASAAGREAYTRFLSNELAPAFAGSSHVLRVRLLHFEPLSGTGHVTPLERQYHSLLELVFANRLEAVRFFASAAHGPLTAGMSENVGQVHAFPVRGVYTCVAEGSITLVGRFGSTIARHITEIGSINLAGPG
jgi:EthD domain